MPYGATLLNDAGRTAFTTDFKSYVFHGKYNPTIVGAIGFGETANYTSSFAYILPPGLTDIIPFVRAVDGTPVGLFAVIPNYNGWTQVFNGSTAVAGTTIRFDCTTPFGPYIGPCRIGPDIYANITAISSAFTGSRAFFGSSYVVRQVDITFDRYLSIPAFVGLYVREGGTLIRCVTNGGPFTPSNYEFYIFKRITDPSGSGWGMRTYNDSGILTFDSNQKVLQIAASARSPAIARGNLASLPYINLDDGSIPVNNAIFSPNMGRYDRMGDNPSAWYRPKSVQRQTLHAKRASASQFRVEGCGAFDSIFRAANDPSFQESPSFAGGSPGNAQILAINTDNYS